MYAIRTTSSWSDEIIFSSFIFITRRLGRLAWMSTMCLYAASASSTSQTLASAQSSTTPSSSSLGQNHKKEPYSPLTSFALRTKTPSPLYGISYPQVKPATQLIYESTLTSTTTCDSESTTRATGGERRPANLSMTRGLHFFL